MGNRRFLAMRSNSLKSILLVALLLLPAVACQAEDVLVLNRTDGNGITKKKGEIVSWTGTTIAIKTATGVKEVDSDRLVRVETDWSPDFLAGDKSLAAGDRSGASELFVAAFTGEDRGWMRNIIHAKRIECAIALGAWSDAGASFLSIIATDPNSRFLHLIPLAWTSNGPPKSARDQAQQWISSSEPAIALLGASWLLESDRDAAKEVLQKLARDFNPRIAALATGQLWRLDRIAIDPKRIAQRIQKVRSMPELCRAGGWYQIAINQSRGNDDGSRRKAVINWFHIVSNDRWQRELCAASLYQASETLKQMGRTTDAARLLQELKEKFGDSTWAIE